MDGESAIDVENIVSYRRGPLAPLAWGSKNCKECQALVQAYHPVAIATALTSTDKDLHRLATRRTVPVPDGLGTEPRMGCDGENAVQLDTTFRTTNDWAVVDAGVSDHPGMETWKS